jgi:hypothetical protein
LPRGAKPDIVPEPPTRCVGGSVVSPAFWPVDNFWPLSDRAPSVGAMTYWINTVSRGHVQRGVAGGFTQANHGKPHMLRRMARGDWIAFYSPKTDYPDGAALQAFTAIGQVVDDEVYQADLDPEFQPWRRKVEFLSTSEAPIRPLLDELGFIEDKARWGLPFHRGVFKIEEHDFEIIRSAMTG